MVRKPVYCCYLAVQKIHTSGVTGGELQVKGEWT